MLVFFKLRLVREREGICMELILSGGYVDQGHGERNGVSGSVCVKYALYFLRPDI